MSNLYNGVVIMGTYTRKVCPRCKYDITGWRKNNEYWRDKIGEPYIQCPNCKSYIRNIQYDEWFKIEKKKKFIICYLIVDLIKSILFSPLLAFLIMYIFTPDKNSTTSNELFFASFIVSPIILFVLHILLLRKYINNSISRITDIKYLKLLYDVRYVNRETFNSIVLEYKLGNEHLLEIPIEENDDDF